MYTVFISGLTTGAKRYEKTFTTLSAAEAYRQRLNRYFAAHAGNPAIFERTGAGWRRVAEKPAA